MNHVPGVSDLGWGFNILGSYSDTSITSQLFAVKDGEVWTDPITGTDYNLPENVSLSLIEQSGGFSRVFDSRSEVQEYFAAKAGIEAKYVSQYGAFSGSFNSAYQKNVDRSEEYKYAFFEANNLAWQLALEGQSVNELTPEFQAAIAELPDTYSKNNQAAFFRFFDRYGTHFVSRVKVGGKLYYYVSVEKTYLSEDTKIEADVTLEYNALLVSAKATSSAEWKQLSKTWTENRTVNIETVGGTPDSLLLAAPEYGEDRSDIFKTWVESIKNAPAAVDFKLRPITTLFPTSKADAAEQAMHAFLTEDIAVVEAQAIHVPYPEPTQPSHLPVISFDGPIQPENPPKHNFGFQVVVVEANWETFSIPLNRYYSYDLYRNQTAYGTMFDQMAQDLEDGGFTQPGYILMLASFNWNSQAPPTRKLYNILRSAGAGPRLESWVDGVNHPGSINAWECTYALVGPTGTGPNQGAEDFGKAKLTSNSSLSSLIAARVQDGRVERINLPSMNGNQEAIAS